MLGSQKVSSERKATRHSIKRKITFSVIGKRLREVEGHTINLSSTGVLFETDTPLKVGMLLEIAIAPDKKKSSTPLEMIVQIVRVENPEEARYHIGCAFKDSLIPNTATNDRAVEEIREELKLAEVPL